MSVHLPAQIEALFDYERTVPVPVIEQNSRQQEGAILREIVFPGVLSEPVPATWMTPGAPGQAPYPGVIFVHPAPGDRGNFFAEALLLARQGIASLLVEAPWTQPETFGQSLMNPEQVREVFI